jgi:hypothetical protein
MASNNIKGFHEERYGSPNLRENEDVREFYPGLSGRILRYAYECPQEKGMHIVDDLYREICGPVSGKPLPAGSVGEVVVTNFSKASCEERITETTKLRASVAFVPEIPEGSKKIDDRRTWK